MSLKKRKKSRLLDFQTTLKSLFSNYGGGGSGSVVVVS